jgi:hypothetical protein
VIEDLDLWLIGHAHDRGIVAVEGNLPEVAKIGLCGDRVDDRNRLSRSDMPALAALHSVPHND